MSKQYWRAAIVVLALAIIVVAHFIPVYKHTGHFANADDIGLCFGNREKHYRFYRLVGGGGSVPAFQEDKKLLEDAGGECATPVELRLYLW